MCGKPVDTAQKRKAAGSLSSDLGSYIEATSVPSTHNPDAILKFIKEEKLRLQYEGGFLSAGDFASTCAAG